MAAEIGKRIRLLREERKLTQNELAKDLDVGRETIARWETGDRDIKTDATIKLAKYFNVTSDYLLGITDHRAAENANIGEVTGLTEENIKNLSNIKTLSEIEFLDIKSEYEKLKNEEILRITNDLLFNLYKDNILEELETINMFAKMAREDYEIMRDAELRKKIKRGSLSFTVYAAVSQLQAMETLNEVKIKIDKIISKICGYDLMKQEIDSSVLLEGIINEVEGDCNGEY